MKPSNYAKFFVSGSEQREFHYSPGPLPIYVIMRTKSYILLSVMVFACGTKHAMDIIKQMVDFKQACVDECRKSEAGNEDRHGLTERYQEKVDDLRDALAGRVGYTISVDVVDQSQLYKIGWAGNDTI